MYQCKLVKNGYQQTCFYREGDSEQEVLKSVKQLGYGRGTWTITDVTELEDDE